MLNMLIWLWGAEGPPDKKAEHFVFRPDDASRLANAIRANLHLEHKITIVSDYPRHHYPSWTEYLSIQEYFGDLRYLRGCWLRLKCFKPEMAAVLGPRVAWIDADSLVTGDLTPLFDTNVPIKLYKSNSVIGQRWNGSVILFSPNAKQVSHVWPSFNPETAEADVRAARKGLKTGPRGTDQAHFHMCFDDDTPHWSRDDGILHWGRSPMRVCPEHARLVVLPGLEKPDSYKVRRLSPWVKALWPLPGDEGPLGYEVTEWPVTPSVEPAPPGRFKSLMKARREARANRLRALTAGQGA